VVVTMVYYIIFLQFFIKLFKKIVGFYYFKEIIRASTSCFRYNKSSKELADGFEAIG
jgi:hypothetical protein